MTRAEHLEWAKQRAREYLDRGDAAQALASFTSDLTKHEELRAHSAFTLTGLLLLGGRLGDTAEVRRHIEGFN